MTLLLDIAPYIAPVLPKATGRDIYARFQDEPDTLAIAVVDAELRPVGLIERNAFLVRMAAQYGHALWSGRAVDLWMKTDPLVADGDVTVAEFCGQVLEERPSELLHGFIVTCAGRYAGVGTMLGLLQASAAATVSHAAEMTELAEAANTASRQALEALAAKQRFLAVMSHEIRTPLNGVLAVAEIIRRKVEQPDLLPFVDTILQSGGVLLRLLNDALDLSRAEASALGLDEEPLAAAALLDDVVGLWSPQAELRGVEFTCAYEGPADLWVLGDRVRLRQIQARHHSTRSMAAIIKPRPVGVQDCSSSPSAARAAVTSMPATSALASSFTSSGKAGPSTGIDASTEAGTAAVTWSPAPAVA